MASQQGSPSAAMMQKSGPPYLPQIWTLGGAPDKSVDVPITAVCLVLYILGAVAHMTIFQLNRKRGHKFLFSGLLFGFCMARITTCVLRIASVCEPHNINLAIAAQIFVAAGVLLVFIINLIFAQRIVRAQHPNWGWHSAFSIFVKIHYVLIVFILAMVITVTVQSFFTLSIHTHKIDRDVQLFASTFLMYVSFLPIPIVVLGLLLPRKQRVDKFGSGRFRTKIVILLLATVLVSLGATYRCATAYLTPVPRTQPLPARFSKAPFYIFNFLVEILVIFLYVIVRVDLRFHVPDGAHGKGSYQASAAAAAGAKQTGAAKGAEESEERRLSRVYTEEETFDNMPDPETVIDSAEDEEKAERNAKKDVQ